MRIRRIRVAGLLVVIAVIPTALAYQLPAYQEQLRDEAVLKYGSDEAAARWVATPSSSAHVSEDAVDIGPSGAAA